MVRFSFKIFLISMILNIYLSQLEKEDVIQENHLRSLRPTPLLNSSTKNAASLKLHSKLLQTVYSESFSKNYYYTTLYIGADKVKQTYVIDTGNSIMSSPCAPCEECNKNRRNYYNILPKKHKNLKCDDKICKMLPATNCKYKKDKDENLKSCSFDVEENAGDGIKGYYLNNIAYFEVDKNLSNPFHRQTYRSYALPIGCTTGEYGKYKELNADGIMGVNYNEKSFIDLLYKLKIINRNIFSLCFGLRGGYMSLGDIDRTFHRSPIINYVPLLTSDNYYLIKVKEITVGKSSKPIISKSEAIIDTGNSISYFPPYIYKPLIEEFNLHCKKEKGKCGSFKFEPEYGYCSSFENREELFKAIYEHWPNITLKLSKESEYIWKPINYYYYYLKNDTRKACLGFNKHKSQNIILGTNFIHGHDIIFDRSKRRLGFVPADCSRGNMIWRRFNGIFRHSFPKFENDPILVDQEVHKNEKEGKFNLGDNTAKDKLDFIQGHNTELDFSSDFKTVNFIILMSSLVIVFVVMIVVIWALLCNKRTYLRYDEDHTNEYVTDNFNENDDGNIRENNNEIGINDENKISFEDNK